MNVFRKLWQSIENLAISLNSLAVTVDSFSQEVRQRTGVSADANVPVLIDGTSEQTARLPAGRRRSPRT